MQRTGIAIAAEPMMRELGLDQVALGWLLTVFLVGYTVFQIPGAVLGEYGGPRRTLTWIGAASLPQRRQPRLRRAWRVWPRYSRS